MSRNDIQLVKLQENQKIQLDEQRRWDQDHLSSFISDVLFINISYQIKFDCLNHILSFQDEEKLLNLNPRRHKYEVRAEPSPSVDVFSSDFHVTWS